MEVFKSIFCVKSIIKFYTRLAQITLPGYQTFIVILMDNQSWTRLCHNPEQNFETEFLISNLEFRVEFSLQFRLQTLKFDT